MRAHSRFRRLVAVALLGASASIAATSSSSRVAVAAAGTILVTRASQDAANPRWDWPIPAPVVVRRAFAAPETPYAAGHRGVDLGAKQGAEVRAPVDATVTFTGSVVDRPVMTLSPSDDLRVSFEPVEAFVPAGERVARGQVIGVVASGGHCDGSCVHVGVRIGGAYVSPMLFFDRVPRAVLLPLRPTGWARRSAQAPR